MLRRFLYQAGPLTLRAQDASRSHRDHNSPSAERAPAAFLFLISYLHPQRRERFNRDSAVFFSP